MSELREKAGSVGEVPDEVSEILRGGRVNKDGCLLLKNMQWTVASPRDRFRDDTAYESFVNHLDVMNETLEEAYRAGKASAEALADLLRSEADRPCQVSWSIDALEYFDDPSQPDYHDPNDYRPPSATIRFVALRSNEPAWIPDDLDGFVQPVEAFDVPSSSRVE